MIKLHDTNYKKIIYNKKYIIFGAVVLVFVLIFSGIFSSKKKNSILNKEEIVKRDDIFVTVLSTGTVAPQNRLVITPTVPGRIESIMVAIGDKVKKGQILAWMSSTERAALIDAARSEGQEELNKWQELYKMTPIIAPIDGTIIVRNVESGQSVISSSEVFVMSDRLTVKAKIDETDISKIKIGGRATIILDAYPDSPIDAWTDKIAFDATTVNSVTTYIVDIVPIKVPGFMRSGMTANITSHIAEKKKVVCVSNDALHVDGEQYYVMIKKNKNKKITDKNQIKRVVKVGVSNGRKTEITSGLNEGDIVIINTLSVDMSTPDEKPVIF